MAGIDQTMAEDAESDKIWDPIEAEADRELARQERQIKHEADLRRGLANCRWRPRIC